MNDEEMKEFMKRKYPEMADFDNLQFVKDCAEDGVKKYKEKVNEVVDGFMRKFIYEEKKCEEVMNPGFTEKDLEELKAKIMEVGLND